jgi:hypothetical protein
MGLTMPCWPPIPAISLNQKNHPKGIPLESIKCHPALEGFRVKWKHFTARKSKKTQNPDRDFGSIKIEQGLGLNLRLASNNVVPFGKINQS